MKTFEQRDEPTEHQKVEGRIKSESLSPFLRCRPEAERWPCLSVSTSLNGQVPVNRDFPHSAQITCLGISF